MTSLKLFFRLLLTYTLSGSLLLSSLPAGVFIFSFNAYAESAPSPAADHMSKLTDDIIGLIARASYPNIPRLGQSGTPSSVELGRIEKDLTQIHQNFVTSLSTRLARTDVEDDERQIAAEVSMFFVLAQKIEGLKILTGQPVNTAEWTELYGLDLPIAQMEQLNFIEAVSTQSMTAAAMPASAVGDLLSNLTPNPSAEYTSELSAAGSAQAVLRLRLNPAFLQDMEQQALISRTSTKNTLLFAAHFTAHRLYDSQNATLALTGTSNLPEVPAFWRDRFASFQTAHKTAAQTAAQMIYQTQKPEIMTLINQSLDRLDPRQDSVLTSEFFATFLPRLQVDPDRIQADEKLSFQRALLALVNLSPVRTLDQVQNTVLSAKRLSLRWMILANSAIHTQLPPDQLARVGQRIEEQSQRFAAALLAKTDLRNAIVRVLAGSTQARLRQRAQFDARMIEAAKKIKSFLNDDIRLNYLMQAQSVRMRGLIPSALVKAVIDSLSQQADYEAAYLSYKKSLLTLLEAYTLPANLKDTKLASLNRVRKQIRFNPSALSGKMEPNYLNALKAHADARDKDISDLLDLGSILRFDVYETLPELKGEDGQPHRKATAANLKIEDGLLGAMIGSELRSYQNEVRKDAFNNAPILSDTWEQLADESVAPSTKSATLDLSLQKTLSTVKQNFASLEEQIKKVDASADDSIASAGEELRAIVTRTSQISYLLSNFGGMAQYYQGVRDELLNPSRLEKEWEGFSNWSNNALIWLFAAWGAQTVLSNFSPAARIAGAIDKLLTYIVGPNFSYFTPMIWGLIAASSVGELYNYAWWGSGPFPSERARAQTLEDYFRCGSGAPCVALYQDFERQKAVADGNGGALLVTAAFIGSIFVITRYGMPAFQWLTNRRAIKGLPYFHADMNILGLATDRAIGQTELQEALQKTLLTARAQTDPRLAELSKIYAQQAYNRLNRRIWQEAVYWTKFDEAYLPILKKTGLSTRQWKDPQVWSQAMDRVERQFNTGHISFARYFEQKSALNSMYKTVHPTWVRMEKNPGVRAFYETVWGFSLDGSMISAQTNMQYFGKKVSDQFMASMNEQLNLTFGRLTASGDIVAQPASLTLDAAMKALLQDLQKNPAQAEARVLEFKKLVMMGGRK